VGHKYAEPGKDVAGKEFNETLRDKNCCIVNFIRISEPGMDMSMQSSIIL